MIFQVKGMIVQRLKKKQGSGYPKVSARFPWSLSENELKFPHDKKLTNPKYRFSSW